MSNSAHEAAEQLRAIRALMERSTIYRAISAPAAAFAGVLSLVVSGWMWLHRNPGEVPRPTVFVLIWAGVLVAVSAVNTVLLYRSATQRGEAFISSGMKHALRALLPPLLAGFILSLLQINQAGAAGESCHTDIAAFWILFYGLALLATGSFSPRSMQALGAGFFILGILTFLPPVRAPGDRQFPVAVIFMAVSFGLLHLVYAAAVWIQNRRDSTSAGA